MKRNVVHVFVCSAVLISGGNLDVQALAADSSASSSKSVSKTTKRAVRAKPVARITEERAVTIVAARPEVKKFLQGIKSAKRKGVTAQLEFDRKEGADLVVHVYEYVPDDAESGHTATFNWYHVNSKTGKVSTEF